MRSTAGRPVARFSPAWPASSPPTCSSTEASPWVSAAGRLLGPLPALLAASSLWRPSCLYKDVLPCSLASRQCFLPLPHSQGFFTINLIVTALSRSPPHPLQFSVPQSDFSHSHAPPFFQNPLGTMLCKGCLAYGRKRNWPKCKEHPDAARLRGSVAQLDTEL